MKYFILIVAVVVLGWFGFTRYIANSQTSVENKSASALVAPRPEPVTTTSALSSSPSAIPPRVAATPIQIVQAVASERIAPAPNPNAPIKIDLKEALGPDNRYQDSVVGLSVMLPEGWTVRDAIRWGAGHTQNTVFLKPDVASSASPSMYYKPYTPKEAASLFSTGAEALLREQAQKKEASRLPGAADYQNVTDSFSFFDVNGSPAMSYFATFTRGDQIMTEHFIRVLSPRGYVMFFTTGKFEDVKVIMPQLKQAAATVKGP
jgi:hypothetical protein